METAGQLLDAGADHTRLYRIVEQRETPERLKLLARALASLELLDDGRLAMMKLSREDFSTTKAQPGESGGFVDFGQSIPSVLVTCVLTEAAPGEYGPASSDTPVTKVSLRSKPIGGLDGNGVDVNVLAKQLGGGGHVRAAGARTSMPLDATARRVLELMRLQTGVT
jgi:phosphoesterase RecJ-like protein